MNTPIATAIILAGGSGKRFKSRIPKVIHSILGQPMVGWVAQAAHSAGASQVIVVGSPETHELISAHLPDSIVTVQPNPRGTGDAADVGLAAMPDGTGPVLILAGDTPCLTSATLRRLLQVHAEHRGIALLTADIAEPGGYGRVVRADNGEITQIVEHVDATAAQRRITEINAGVYVADAELLRQLLPSIGSDNQQGEKYLVDIVDRAVADGTAVNTVTLTDAAEIQGVNDRAQLATAQAVLQARVVRELQLAGATIMSPGSVVIEPTVSIGRDVLVGPSVSLTGDTHIADDVIIGQGCVLADTRVAAGVQLLPYSVASNAVIGEDATVGPHTHLRPGSVLGPGSKVGNFVELKNTTLGAGSKANHLAYVGDATVGRGVNIGAGTITCNYDGVNKHRTILEDGVFIGSDTQLVAPVTVGRDAVVGAGTTVTRDVKAESLAVSRSEQKEIPGYAARVRARKKARDENKS